MIVSHLGRAAAGVCLLLICAQDSTAKAVPETGQSPPEGTAVSDVEISAPIESPGPTGRSGSRENCWARARSGVASWYGPGFQGNPTASGDRFDMNARTAASNTHPFGTEICVVSTSELRWTVVRINDRGGFSHLGRTLDLSLRAAADIGLVERGVGTVLMLPPDCCRSRRVTMQEVADAGAAVERQASRGETRPSARQRRLR